MSLDGELITIIGKFGHDKLQFDTPGIMTIRLGGSSTSLSSSV
jgi:hypothetical protein